MLLQAKVFSHNLFINELGQAALQAFNATFAGAKEPSLNWDVPPPNVAGDLALSCFEQSRTLKQNPAEIAKKWSKAIDKPVFISSIEALGPYINFTFDSSSLAKEIFKQGADYANINIGAGKKILIEYSAPNTNKPLHLGHGRNNSIGFFLCELYRQFGFRVVPVNLINDRGIHICKSMLTYQLFAAGKTPQSEGLKGDHFVGEYYVRYSALEKEDPQAGLQASLLLKKWEDGDTETRATWKKLNDWAISGLEQTYQRAGISFEKVYRESETYLEGKKIVLDALEKGLCQEEENGAVSIDLNAYGLGKKILIRGDQTSVYITQDISTTSRKFKDFAPDSALWVVGSEQEHHFKVLFATLAELKIAPAEKCEHVSYGIIELPDGKMKSREGKRVDLDDLYDHMREQARERLVQKNIGHGYSDLEVAKIAEAVGQSAINFFILRTSSAKNIVFDINESLSFDGMTGPYLLYTYARICSILRKAEQDSLADFMEPDAWHEDEQMLLREMYFFPSRLRLAFDTKNPAIIASYAYDLARIYNRFYQNCPILQSTEAKFRINLTIMVEQLLGRCFSLLNLTKLERM